MLSRVLINIFYITYPFAIYLFYTVCTKNYHKKHQKLLFALTIWSSLYINIKHGIVNIGGESIILFNIPIIIAYIKKEIPLSIMASIVAIYLTYLEGLDITLISFGYVLYFVIYLFARNKKNYTNIIMNGFITLKSFIITVQLVFCKAISADLSFLIQVFILILSYYVITYLVLLMYNKAEELSKFYFSLKEIQKQKQIKNSLFKITHEIKNPLAVCKGYLDMLDCNNQDQVKRFIPIIEQEVNHTLILLNDFLDLTKVNIVKEEMDINYLLENVVKTLQPVIRSKKINFETELIDDDIYINADYERLIQVFINIIKNSIEAIDHNEGKISLKNSMKKDKIIVEIIDNGSGMTDEVLAKYDQGFFTTKENGTGLGVLMCKEIIKAHDGEIIYESVYLEGTKVKITLPLK